jgi:hypothetical protein
MEALATDPRLPMISFTAGHASAWLAEPAAGGLVVFLVTGSGAVAIIVLRGVSGPTVTATRAGIGGSPI